MPDNFELQYHKLNPAQRQAVDTIDGPVMVLAGPGTGKTQVLSVRIANILQKTDTAPDAILALTFTESAAKNMQRRLTSIIGPTAYSVTISTFHSFCSEIIQSHPDEFPISLESEALSELEKIEIIQQILDSVSLIKLRPINTPYFYLSEIIRRLQELKREAVSLSDFAAILQTEKTNFEAEKHSFKKSEIAEKEKNLAKNEELLSIYRAYQAEIKNRGRYDFEDMINLVIEKFESDEDFLLLYQERFHYFLVDEYQDSNSAQNKVLKLLVSFWKEKANFFVVGDPNQSIYRFQGASLENIFDFEKTYPAAQIISLTHNYRSSSLILDASYDLISHNKSLDLLPALHQKLEAQNDYPSQKINVLSFPSESVEEYFLVRKLKSLLAEGVDPEEIAVLYRHNYDASTLSELLSKEGLRYNLEGGVDILKDPTINQLLTLLCVIEKSKTGLEDLDLFTLLHYEFLKFNAFDILKLSRAAAIGKKSLFDIITDEKSPSDLISSASLSLFQDFLKQIALWQKISVNKNFSEFFEILLKESGFLDWLLASSDRVEKLNRLNSLFAEVKAFNRAYHNLNLSQFLTALDLMIANNLRIQEEDLDLSQNAITLSTVHKAKGKEWGYVFIIKALDGKWGNNRKRELIKLPSGILENTNLADFEENEDERRLFYVALTRAKKEIFVSYSETTLARNRKKENIPTLFLSELDSQYLNSETKLDFNQSDILESLLILENQKDDTFLKEEEKAFLSKIIADFKMSPTALNTYLSCPYKFKLNNLIKVPRAKNIYFAFGTAVHRALELFHQKFRNESILPKKEYLLQEFEKALQKEVLLDLDFRDRLKKGQEILTHYYDYYVETFVPPLFTEKLFGYSYSRCLLNDIPLSGKVDRIDLLDPTKKLVKVVDYKTGKPKSRNEIEGKTGIKDDSYKIQLVFYKLLSELDHNFNFEVTETEFDFVEKDASGKFHRESFTISRVEVSELKKTIQEVMAKIRHLEFAKTKNYEECDRCEFKNHCYPGGLPKS